MARTLDHVVIWVEDPLRSVEFFEAVVGFPGVRARLQQHGIAPAGEMVRSFGARGLAPRTFYFRDPDANVFEARYYAE